MRLNKDIREAIEGKIRRQTIALIEQRFPKLVVIDVNTRWSAGRWERQVNASIPPDDRTKVYKALLNKGLFQVSVNDTGNGLEVEYKDQYKALRDEMFPEVIAARKICYHANEVLIDDILFNLTMSGSVDAATTFIEDAMTKLAAAIEKV